MTEQEEQPSVPQVTTVFPPTFCYIKDVFQINVFYVDKVPHNDDAKTAILKDFDTFFFRMAHLFSLCTFLQFSLQAVLRSVRLVRQHQ